MITRITKTEFLEKNGHRLDGEEDIIENLTQIVKGFSVHFFKDDLFQNPFYKLLLLDIKKDVLRKNTYLHEEIHR